jgi:hypothetical protein
MENQARQPPRKAAATTQGNDDPKKSPKLIRENLGGDAYDKEGIAHLQQEWEIDT